MVVDMDDRKQSHIIIKADLSSFHLSLNWPELKAAHEHQLVMKTKSKRLGSHQEGSDQGQKKIKKHEISC